MKKAIAILTAIVILAGVFFLGAWWQKESYGSLETFVLIKIREKYTDQELLGYFGIPFDSIVNSGYYDDEINALRKTETKAQKNSNGLYEDHLVGNVVNVGKQEVYK